MFDTLVAQLSTLKNDVEHTPVTLDNYKQWQKEYTFQGLTGMRYGQSFCNWFNITDNRIFYDCDWSRCDRIIRSEWLARS